MAKFELGEIAIFVGNCQSAAGFKNTEVTICLPPDEEERAVVERFKIAYPGQHIYCFVFSDGVCGRGPEADLRKRPPETYKGQFAPYDKSFDQTIKELGYREEPLEETMKRVTENMAGWVSR